MQYNSGNGDGENDFVEDIGMFGKLELVSNFWIKLEVYVDGCDDNVDSGNNLV